MANDNKDKTFEEQLILFEEKKLRFIYAPVIGGEEEAKLISTIVNNSESV